MFEASRISSWHRMHLGIIGLLGLLLVPVSRQGTLASATPTVSTAKHQSAQSAASAESPESNGSAQKLQITNQPLTRSLSGGQIHRYSIDLVAGQFFHVVIEQEGIDLIVKIVKVAGLKEEVVVEVDRPNGSQGPEAVSLIAPETGEYRIQVFPASKQAVMGRYQILAQRPRQAEPRDQMQIAAERAVCEGERLRSNQNVESKREAINQFELALGLWQTLGEAYEEAVAYYGLGLSYRQLGENQKAVSSFKNGFAIMRSQNNRYGAAITQTGLAWSYLYLGAVGEALDNFSQALRLRHAVNDRNGEALTLYGIGWAYDHKGEQQQALDYFLRSLSLRQELRDLRGEAVTRVGIGHIYSRMQRGDEALSHLHRALAIVRELGDSYLEADTLDRLGWAHLALNQVSTAAECFQQALPLRRMVGDSIGEAAVRHGLAQAEYRQGRLSAARDQMEASLALIESSRAEVSSPQFRTTFFASVADYYQFAIKVLMRMHEEEPSSDYAALALQISERARARSLLDLLSEARAELRSEAPAQLLESERILRQEINLAADRQRSRGRTDTANAAKLTALLNQYEEIQSQIRTSSPRYAALVRPAPLSLADLQRLLDDDTLLLEYAVGEERSYLWAVTPTSLESHPLPGRAVIQTDVRHLLNSLGDVQRPPQQQPINPEPAKESFYKAAAALSQTLLSPVAAQLKNKRLVIVADDALQYLPFAALPAPSGMALPRDGDSKTPASYQPLIVEHEIISLPSASVLASLRGQLNGRRPAPKTIAVLADPVFEITDVRVKTGGPRGSREGVKRQTKEINAPVAERTMGPERLLRLPFTRLEANSVVPLVAPGQRLLALDFAANRETAMSADLAQYRIIHFATHSLLDEVHPELTGIALSLVDERGRAQNGFLHLQDIYDLKLNADLVVLSACRTGLGKEVRGEGLIGLTRGFMYAGVPRIAVSLWKVDDKATAELMKNFYQALLGKQGLPPAAALRQAQLALFQQNRWRDPIYWAAFVLQGEWQ